MKRTPIDIAWFAGIYEGEGYSTKGSSLRLTIGMTDRDIVARAAKIMGTPITKPYIRPSYSDRPHLKPMYTTSCFGGHAAGWMMTLYKFMGKRRRAQFRKFLRIWKKQQMRIYDGSRRATCHPGRVYLAKGLCRSCYRKQFPTYYRRKKRGR